jgi:hypothetical protein
VRLTEPGQTHDLLELVGTSRHGGRAWPSIVIISLAARIVLAFTLALRAVAVRGSEAGHSPRQIDQGWVSP